MEIPNEVQENYVIKWVELDDSELENKDQDIVSMTMNLSMVTLVTKMMTLAT